MVVGVKGVGVSLVRQRGEERDCGGEKEPDRGGSCYRSFLPGTPGAQLGVN